jgi:hypothetical protein
MACGINKDQLNRIELIFESSSCSLGLINVLVVVLRGIREYAPIENGCLDSWGIPQLNSNPSHPTLTAMIY